MRVFLAFSIADEAQSALLAAIQRLEPLTSDVKWCGREQFHVTLAFLGEISPPILSHVRAAADRVCASTPPFLCRARGLGFFGTKRFPQTLWAGIDPAPELAELRERLWSEFKRFGLKNAEPGFRPHVTLGRCRENANGRGLTDAIGAEAAAEFGAWTVTRVTLYESRPTPRGAVYRTLSRSTLGASPALNR